LKQTSAEKCITNIYEPPLVGAKVKLL